LLGRDWAGVVSPLAPLIGENIGDFLVVQGFLPRLHHRSAIFLAFDGYRALQTFEDNHG
jgi:hypothetical protein